MRSLPLFGPEAVDVLPANEGAEPPEFEVVDDTLGVVNHSFSPVTQRARWKGAPGDRGRQPCGDKGRGKEMLL